MQNQLVPGTNYRHYKGKIYNIIGIGHHTETLEKMVIYQALYDSTEFGDQALWVRPLSMFQETVIIDGDTVQRFSLC